MGEMIKVRVRAFAAVREALGSAETEISLPRGTDVAGLLAQLAASHPDARLADRRLAVAVNRVYAPPDRVLADGDELALIPPVSGGSPKLFEITERPLSLDDIAARVSAPEHGGITVFAGTVRGVTGDVQTECLEYEAYAEMAEEVLANIGAEVQRQWPAVTAISIVHRVGRLNVGEASVVIAVASAHRADTFPACHYAIDRVKAVAPIWKREIGPDGSFWVEGPAEP